jgi:hypothetical protein
LFVEYAKNIQTMIQSASNKQSELLNVINDLFIFVNDPYSDKKKIRVNPTLTEDKLQKIVERTRNIIIELYVRCEMNFVDNLKVYEAIVESKILETTKKQIDNLEKKADDIINETKKTVAAPETKNANEVPMAPPMAPPMGPPMGPPMAPPMAPPMGPPMAPPMAPPMGPPMAPPMGPPMAPPGTDIRNNNNNNIPI